MIFRAFVNAMKKIDSTPNVLLGRWGYHWEKKLKYQIYYE